MAHRVQLRGRVTILVTSLQAALTAHLTTVSLPAPKSVSPRGGEGWQHWQAQAAQEELTFRHAWRHAWIPLQQHINLSSPVSKTPCSFNLNVHILTPRSKKPLMPGNQQLKSQDICHLMVNAVLSKIPSFPQSPFPATSSPGTTSFSPRKAGSDLKALLPQPPTPSSALACPISVQAAQLQPPPLRWWRCRGTAQTPCWNPGVPTCCASGLYHYLAHQYLLVLATHFQVSFHINYCSLISLAALTLW